MWPFNKKPSDNGSDAILTDIATLRREVVHLETRVTALATDIAQMISVLTEKSPATGKVKPSGLGRAAAPFLFGGVHPGTMPQTGATTAPQGLPEHQFPQG